MTIYLLILIGLASSVSELSNQGKLDHWWYWFSQAAWQNKNKWKPYPIWRFWPFIIFTDAFHFFKTIWVIAMCYAIFFGGLNAIYSFGIYSVSFQVFYWILPYIKVK